MGYMFSSCYNLLKVPEMKTEVVTDMTNMFNTCRVMWSLPTLDMQKVNVALGSFLAYCYGISDIKIKNLNQSLDMSACGQLNKESLLYITNNESATSAITITLHSYAYSRLAEDADIVAALAEHPLVSLASA
jgi:hypothetical protein